MKIAVIAVVVAAMSGMGLAFIGVTPATNSPPITRYTETDSAPTELGAPLVPDESSIHVNGQVAYQVSGPSGLELIVDNVAQSTHRTWASPNLPNVRVDRSILINGVNYKDDSQPLIIVWTATLTIPGQQFPTFVNLTGSDFNCSGGGISVTP